MTAKGALAMALLDGRVLNVKNCFESIGLTNIAREIPRLIEKPFGVQVSRTPRKGKSRYGTEVKWMDYRLNRANYNSEGISKMMEYCMRQNRPSSLAKTEKEKKILKQQELFLNTLQ